MTGIADLQLAVCPVATLSDLTKNVFLEVLDVLGSPVLDPAQGGHAEAR